MKLFSILMIVVAASTAHALSPDFRLYLRAGSGTNGRGGAQECVNNAGSGGNEFRLANECGIYGEFQWDASVLKAETANDPFWRLHTNFAVVYDNKKDFEDSNTKNWVLREVYTEAGRIDGMDFSVWVGKRFYRWSDLNLDDFFTLDMSGPGAGIGDLALGSGKASIGVIQNTASEEIKGGAVTTKAGSAAKTSLHFRWDEVASEWGVWSFWAGVGHTPATSELSGTREYKASTGEFLAVKNQFDFAGGKNEVGLAFGQGVMSNLGPWGELTRDCGNDADPLCTVDRSQRLRAWEAWTAEFNKWSTQFVIIHEDVNNGASLDSKLRWTSVGVRPIYWFTDHWSLALQAGRSSVDDQSDGLGERTLDRFTVSPQLSLGKGFFSRPVIRAYYSRTQWSSNNKKSVATTSARNDSGMDTLGFQTELWF